MCYSQGLLGLGTQPYYHILIGVEACNFIERINVKRKKIKAMALNQTTS